MPRKPRIFVPGGIYHVILRGNGRQTIFFSNLDRRRWSHLLKRGLGRYRCRIHAYCLMTNHIHMAVQVSDLPLGPFIGWVASQYARSVNRRLGTSGHLFERRYHSTLIADDNYLLQVVRYIHLNPVVAQMAVSPDEYAWSSHRTYLGYRQESWLTMDLVLSVFNKGRRQAMQAYQSFMGEADSETTADRANYTLDDWVNDDGEFAEIVHRREVAPSGKLSLSQLIDEHCQRYNICADELASPRRTRRNAKARAEIAIAAQQFGIATLHEVASRFNRSDSALSHAIGYVLEAKHRAKQ